MDHACVKFDLVKAVLALDLQVIMGQTDIGADGPIGIDLVAWVPNRAGQFQITTA